MSARRLGASCASTPATPVTLPPGCDRLLTSQLATGSLNVSKPTGMVFVALVAGSVLAVDAAKSTSTRSFTNSAAAAAKASRPPSIMRRSSRTVRPSTWPSSASLATNASVSGTPGTCGARMPTTGTRAACARLLSGIGSKAKAAAYLRRTRRFMRARILDNVRNYLELAGVDLERLEQPRRGHALEDHRVGPAPPVASHVAALRMQPDLLGRLTCAHEQLDVGERYLRVERAADHQHRHHRLLEHAARLQRHP